MTGLAIAFGVVAFLALGLLIWGLCAMGKDSDTRVLKQVEQEFPYEVFEQIRKEMER